MHIGPAHACFAQELWQGVFEASHTLEDATAWAQACGITPCPSDWRSLVAVRAPSLLALLPKPSPARLKPDAAPHMQPFVIDYSPLCRGIYDDQRPFTQPADAQSFAPLFEAAHFMCGFAQDSSVTAELIDLSVDAWVQCCADEATNIGAYRSRCASFAMFDALHTHAKTAAVRLGHKAQMPPFFAGMPALRSLRLFELDSPIDMRPFESLRGLRHVGLSAATPPEVVQHFTQSLQARRPDITVSMLDPCAPAPPACTLSPGYLDMFALHRQSLVALTKTGALADAAG